MEKYATLRPLTGHQNGDVGGMFHCIADRLKTSSERGCIQFRILDKEDHQYWCISLAAKSCKVRQEMAKKPDLEVITSLEIWKKIASGELSPLVAFAQRKMRIRGDENLGKRLLKQLASAEGKLDIC
jgi:putative sterol carrier protein